MIDRLPSRPKGSMCCSCVHRYRDCSRLDFASMQTMYREGGVWVVYCNEYLHGKPAKLVLDISGEEHQKHTDGFVAAMADRTAAYKPDPAPRIHRTVQTENTTAPRAPGW